MIPAAFYAIGLVWIFVFMWRDRPCGRWWIMWPLFAAIWPVVAAAPLLRRLEDWLDG